MVDGLRRVAGTAPSVAEDARPSAAGDVRPKAGTTSRAPATGQTLTHSLHEMHSDDVTIAAVATSTFIGQARSHRPQSMQVPGSRLMRKMLTLARSPSSAPVGQRYLQKKRS